MPEKTENVTIPARFREVVDLYGDRVAVSTDSIQWTYAELDRLSDTVAHTVVDRTSNISEPVALVMDHGAPLIAAVLGVLKAGKMYLVLDPIDPTTRLQTIIADAQAALLLSDEANRELAGSLSQGSIDVVEVAFDLDAESPNSGRTLPLLTSDNGAWMCYTSGSTGVPKAVWQDHAGTIGHADVFAELIQAGPGDRFSLLTSLSLSSSTSALFAALFNGTALCPFHIRTDGIERLPEWLQRQSITVFHSVPTIFRGLMRVTDDDRYLRSLRVVRLGGEPIRVSDVDLYRRHCPDTCRLMLSLSSTESGLITAALIDKQSRLPRGIVPASFPVRGVEVDIVSEQGDVLPFGKEGRIAVRSAHVRQGYWRHSEATAHTFQPEKSDPNIRRFITGDLGRILEDGSLLHLGRIDQVVKIRGRRVDLLEVEEGLCACELVKEAAAAAAEDHTGGNRLVGYVVLRPGVEAPIQDLRLVLTHLPGHLIPSSFVILEHLPQTPGGKLDRRALGLLSPQAGAANGAGLLPLNVQTGPLNRRDHVMGLGTDQMKDTRYGRVSLGLEKEVVALEVEVEYRVADILRDALNCDRIGLDDDFFDLGGDSLGAVTVMAAVEANFGVSLPVSAILEATTPRSLARLVSEARTKAFRSCIIRVQNAVSGLPLVVVHGLAGDVIRARKVISKLDWTGPVYGVRALGLRAGETPLSSIPDMAARYTSELRSFQPNGPYLLYGYCGGAFIAYEMAQQLRRAGEDVSGLIMLGPPIDWRRSPFLVASGVGLEFLKWAADARFQWSRLRSIFVKTKDDDYRRVAVARALWRALAHYEPKPYTGEALMIHCHETSRILLNTKRGLQTLMHRGRFLKGGENHHSLFKSEDAPTHAETRAFIESVDPA